MPIVPKSDYPEEYTKAVNKLMSLSHETNNAPYKNKNIDSNFYINQACISTINYFITFKTQLMLSNASDNFFDLTKIISLFNKNISSPHDAAQEIYQNALEFYKVSIASNTISAEQLHLIDEIVVAAMAAHRNPNATSPQEALRTAGEKLQKYMEKKPLTELVLNAARKLYSSVCVLLGLLVVISSVTSGIGLLLTLGTLIITAGKHAGPITLGKDLASYGIDKWSEDPRQHEKEIAKKLTGTIKSQIREREDNKTPPSPFNKKTS